jgi:Resolvase, N terminal domain
MTMASLESMLSIQRSEALSAKAYPQVGHSHKLGSKRLLITHVIASAIETGGSMDYGYARVSTTAQDLTRQVDTLTAAGIPEELIWSDRRTGATMAREGLEDLLRRVPPHAGHRITVVTLMRPSASAPARSSRSATSTTAAPWAWSSSACPASFSTRSTVVGGS